MTKRRVVGLSMHAAALEPATADLFLVQIVRGRFVRDRYCVLDLRILEPEQSSGLTFSVRLELADDRIWKLAWLLRDFGYDEKLLALDQIDTARLSGLTGIVRITESDLVSGRTYRIDASAPTAHWSPKERQDPEAA